MEDSIGYIVGGGLREGFNVRLTVPADEVQEGSFVVCENGRFRFYGLVTDLRLGATDPRFADERPDRISPVIQRALLGKTVHTTMEMYPTLLLDMGPDLTDPRRAEWEADVEAGKEMPGPKPVKTIPAHHALVRMATAGDVADIFDKDGVGMFMVGRTIEQGHPIRLNLNKFVERSSGIFGATGTGKSFLTRMILAGLIKEKVASALIFDMHNEYAYDVPSTKPGQNDVKGLHSLFGSQIVTVTLGTEQIRGHSADLNLILSLKDITTEDILLLGQSLNLTDTTASTLSALYSEFKGNWFSKFMQMIPGKMEETEIDSGRTKKVPAPDSVEYWADRTNVNQKAATALHNKLMRIYRQEYVKEKVENSVVPHIIDYLENERHVILSFGKYDNDLDYLLISNILTRMLRKRWIEKTESYYLRGQGATTPKPLLIVIEEAHKLLNPNISKETTFGTIARELRKYYVTLLVVDQRPSGIDDEIMSQLGTRITGWLGDDDDIRAVLTGLAGREQLRGMLARLLPEQEVLLLGWGVKMPIPVRSRRYDAEFWREMKGGKASSSPASSAKSKEEDANAIFF